MKRRRRVGCDGWGELAHAVIKDKNGSIRLVWTPDHPRMVPPEEVPGLFDTIVQRNTRRYTQVRNWSIASTLLWGLLGIVNLSRPALLPIYLINIFALGVLPLAQSIWELRKLENYTLDKMAQDVATARYRAWTGSQKALVTWGLCVSILLIALLQFFTTISSIILRKELPIEAAGLVKDAVWEGEVWRLLTGPLLHANFLHLYFNVLTLLVLGSVVEAMAGWALFSLLLLLSIVSGSIFSLLLLPATSVGVSGGLMGLIGFLTMLGYFHRKHLPPGFLRSMLYSIALIAALGVIAFSYIDNAAHLGGLVAGVILGLVFIRGNDPIFPIPTNKIAYYAGVFSVITLLAAVLLTIGLIMR
ncbi:MAG TPA: rhomboid family intramembrane serine protease [Chloroflexia bacterium]|nr:rhomboid family intramembrane serine protease [Chloroflexia bacterium]